MTGLEKKERVMTVESPRREEIRQEQDGETRVESGSVLGCLIPTFWMLVGNGILALSALAIAAGSGSFGVADAFYWGTVGCMSGARYADICYFSGRTAEGKPATMAHWRRYSVILLVVSGAVWIAVHLMPELGL